MEFLLQYGLVVAAIIAIGITVIMVWPDRGAHAVGTPSDDVEAQAATMAMERSALPPQGDRFEDQYTSATADLSAGGVAAAPPHEQSTPAPPTRTLPEARGTGEHNRR